MSTERLMSQQNYINTKALSLKSSEYNLSKQPINELSSEHQMNSSGSIMSNTEYNISFTKTSSKQSVNNDHGSLIPNTQYNGSYRWKQLPEQETEKISRLSNQDVVQNQNNHSENMFDQNDSHSHNLLKIKPEKKHLEQEKKKNKSQNLQGKGINQNYFYQQETRQKFEEKNMNLFKNIKNIKLFQLKQLKIILKLIKQYLSKQNKKIENIENFHLFYQSSMLELQVINQILQRSQINSDKQIISDKTFIIHNKCKQQELNHDPKQQSNSQYSFKQNYLINIEINLPSFQQIKKLFTKIYQNNNNNKVINQTIHDLIPEISLLQNKLLKQLQQIKKVIIQKTKYQHTIFNSTIIYTKKNQSKLLQLIGKQFKSKTSDESDEKFKRVKSATLLYRASDAQFKASIFHQNCDGKAQTILIAKSKNPKQNIFGGYNQKQWGTHKLGKYISAKEPQCFLYSLTNETIFSLSPLFQKQAIKYKQGCGPIFGQDLIFLNKKTQVFVNIGNCYQYKKDEKLNTKQLQMRLTGQKEQFIQLQDYEIFQLHFDNEN